MIMLPNMQLKEREKGNIPSLADNIKEDFEVTEDVREETDIDDDEDKSEE